MKSLTLLTLCVSLTQALPELSISKLSPHGQAAAGASRRELSTRHRSRTVDTNVFDVLRWSGGGGYYANITVGSPPQNQTVILDTGSSDLYFDASNSTSCANPPEDAPCLGGTFDRSRSKTYRQLSSTPTDIFNTSFGDGSTAVGPYGADVIGIGSVSLTNVQFGVAEEIKSNISLVGLLGLGYSAGSSLYPNEGVRFSNQTYPNLVDSMVDAGAIESRLYSVHLGRQSDLSGSILFGGIDTSRYDGPLTTLNLLPVPGDNASDPRIERFITTITDAQLTVQGQNHTLWRNGVDDIEAYKKTASARAVLLDTGSAAWYVDYPIYYEIVKLMPAVDSNGNYHCDEVDSNGFLGLTFGGKARIDVSLTEIFAPIVDRNTGEAVVDPATGRTSCALLIGISDDPAGGYWIAGDAILRSMYTVFDLDNGQVSIAQASTDTSKPPNIVEVKAGPDGVAKAVSEVVTAPSNTWPIASAPTGTLSVSAATLATPIGTATGVNAIPPEGQVAGSIPVVGGSVSSTFTTSITTPTITPTNTPSTPATPSPGRGTCSKDGALVCNGPNEFGLCNFGQVVWQPVAPGTACKNDGIIGVGIYAVPE